MDVKTKRPVSKATIVVLVCLATGIVLCAALAYIVVFAPRPATGMPVSIWGDIDRQMRIEEGSSFQPPSEYYPSTDEAVRHRFVREEGNLELLSDELFRFEDEDSVTVFCLVDNLQGEHILTALCMDKKGGRFSNVLFLRGTTLHPGDWLKPANYQFSDEDAAAHYIFETLTAYDAFSRANSGQWTTIGVSENDSVYDMTVLGRPPTEIYTIYDEGVRYYVWCYVGFDMREALIGKSEGGVAEFTLGSIAEKLDIRFG